MLLWGLAYTQKMRFPFLLVWLLHSFQAAQAQPQNTSSKSYGIILSGGINPDSNYYRYYNSTANVHKAFINSGIEKKDVYTYFGSGNSNINDTKKQGMRKKHLAKDNPDILFNAASSFKKK